MQQGMACINPALYHHFSFSSFVLVLASYSSLLLTPFGMPFGMRLCSSTSRALISITFFRVAMEVRQVCQASTLGKSLMGFSSGGHGDMSIVSFQGAKAMLAKVYSSLASQPLLSRALYRTQRVRSIAEGIFLGCRTLNLS